MERAVTLLFKKSHPQNHLSYAALPYIFEVNNNSLILRKFDLSTSFDLRNLKSENLKK